MALKYCLTFGGHFKAAELDMLRAEVIKSIRGGSTFSQELPGSPVKDAETKCLEVQRLEAAQQAYEDGQAMLANLNTQYDDIVSWADLYDTAGMEAKKMIAGYLIKRVDVYRDYKLHIDFNIDFEQFSAGADIAAIAAESEAPLLEGCTSLFQITEITVQQFCNRKSFCKLS